MATYRTKDGSQTGFIPGVGPIINGYLYNAPDDIENYNFIKVADPVSPSEVAPEATAIPVVQSPVEQINTQSEGTN